MPILVVVLGVGLVGCGKGQKATPSSEEQVSPSGSQPPGPSVPQQPTAPTVSEEKAIAAIEKLGGRIERDDKKPGNPVRSVSFWGTQLTDAGLKELQPFKELTSLNLYETKITDAGLKDVAQL